MPQTVSNYKSFHNKHKVWLIDDTFILSPPDLTYHFISSNIFNRHHRRLFLTSLNVSLCHSCRYEAVNCDTIVSVCNWSPNSEINLSRSVWIPNKSSLCTYRTVANRWSLVTWIFFVFFSLVRLRLPSDLEDLEANLEAALEEEPTIGLSNLLLGSFLLLEFVLPSDSRWLDLRLGRIGLGLLLLQSLVGFSFLTGSRLAAAVEEAGIESSATSPSDSWRCLIDFSFSVDQEVRAATDVNWTTLLLDSWSKNIVSQLFVTALLRVKSRSCVPQLPQHVFGILISPILLPP